MQNVLLNDLAFLQPGDMRRLQHVRGIKHVLLLCFIASSFCSTNASNANVLKFIKAQEQQPCQPWTVPPEERCSYVILHAQSCYPDGGFQRYLEIHFCTFTSWPWLSLLIPLCGAVLCFGLLLTVSERFFCPALELISEYLKLPPVVAGATLLSFGNGAPDIFTLVAAVGQGGSAAVGMALAEPLGGGLFNSNIVFGLVVLIASKTANVKLKRWPFIKDLGFYLVALLLMVACLADGKVVLWETGAMGLVYVVYVYATFYISRHDEPVHADLPFHEVPQEEGVDFADSCSEYSAETQPTPELMDRATSITSHDLEAAATAAIAATASHTHLHPVPHTVVIAAADSAGSGHRRTVSSSAASNGVPSSRALRTSPSGRNRHPLKEPLLSPVEESSWSPTAVSAAAAATLAPAAAGSTAEAPAIARETHSMPHALFECPATPRERAAEAVEAALAAELAAAAARSSSGKQSADHGCNTDALSDGSPPSASPASVSSSKVQPYSGRTLHRCKTFSEGITVTVGTQANGVLLFEGDSGFGPEGLPWPYLPKFSPRACSDGMLSPLYRSSPGSLSGLTAASSGSRRMSSPELLPLVQQLAEQHQQEQQELLEQQYEEQLALVVLHEEEQKVKGRWSLKHRLQHPLVLLLSCTMPRVGTGHGHRYQRWRACLLPFTAPLTLFLAAPSLLPGVGHVGLLYSGLVAAVGSAIIWATYPASSVPRKNLKGVFAVMTFVQAVMWLNIAASALVQICLVVGIICQVQPALMASTVLAYGNAVPDLINNMALARDGFPSMAVAACFASPLFVLLVGIGSALAYGIVLNHGVLAVPVDGPLLVMAGFGVVNLAKYLLLVPLVYRFQMKKKMAVTAFLYYACFNVVYGLVVAGVIKINVGNLWGALNAAL